MKNSKIIYSIALCSLLVLALAIVNFNLRTKKGDNKVNNTTVLENLESKTDMSNLCYEVEAKSKFVPELSLLSLNNIKKNLQDVVGNTPKLVVRYTSIDCNSCFDLMLKKVLTLADSIGNHNLIFISSKQEYSEFNNFCRVKKITFPAYMVLEDYDTCFPFIGKPYLFVLDNNLQPRLIYVAGMDNHIFDEYIKLLKYIF